MVALQRRPSVIPLSVCTLMTRRGWYLVAMANAPVHL